MQIMFCARTNTHHAVDASGVVQFIQRDDETLQAFKARVFGEEA